jgi:phage terminase large subunit-like protein
VTPQDEHANSWEDAADLSEALGVPLDSWQEDVLRASLGERRDGMWTARQVGLSAPRQNGKSQLIVARFIAGALLFGERKIIVSAHQQDTARETFSKFLEILDDSPALQKRIKPNGIMQALNRESITFTNGAKVQFKARSGAGGRGFSCDCLLLDEAQILSQRVWVAINSTMSARPNPQVWLLGTPPTPDDDGGCVRFGPQGCVEW